MNMLHRLRCLAVLLALAAPSSDAAELPVLPVPDWQPFAAQVRRVSEALTLAGSPLSAKERADLEADDVKPFLLNLQIGHLGLNHGQQQRRRYLQEVAQ